MSRRRMTRAGTTAKVSTAALLLLAVSACGSETSDDGDAGANGESSGTLTDEAFCDSIDPAMVADVLGMSASGVKVMVDREVGEEFEGPDEEAPPVKSVANMCSLGSGTAQLTVSVQPDATAEDVQKTIDEMESLSGKGSSEVCEPQDASAFGDPAGAFSCEARKPMQRVRFVATGLVGDSKFYCAAMVNAGAGADFADNALDVCRSIMEDLAASA